MNQWAFVVGAYAVTAAATIGLLIWAYISMRNAENELEALKRRQ